MQIPVKVDLEADRWTPFKQAITFSGLSLTGATLAMQLRLEYDAPGSALVSLTNVGSVATQGIYIVNSTEISILINESTMENLPAAEEVGDDLVLRYDLHITPAGGIKQVYLRGKFTVRGGATQ